MKEKIAVRLFIAFTVVVLIGNGVCENVYVAAGENLLLECPFKKMGNYNLGWALTIQNGSSYQISDGSWINTNIFPRAQIVGNKSEGVFNLYISSIRKSDEGNYSCSVTNPIGLQKHTFSLYLSVLPGNVNIKDTTVDNKLLGSEGVDLTVLCEVDGGKPPPNVSLIVDGHVLVEQIQNAEYTFLAIARGYDKKTLICKVQSSIISNPVMVSVEINLNLKPLLPGFNKDPVSTEVSLPLSLSCTSKGSRPVASICWTLGKNNITSYSNQQSTIDDDGTYRVTSELTYNTNRTDNEKLLICNVSNTAGWISKNTTVDVKYKPSVDLKNRTFSQNDNTRSLTCLADGNPAIYSFHKWQHKTLFGNSIRELEGGSNGTLILPDAPLLLRYQDSGMYICTVTNGIMDENRNDLQTGTAYVTIMGQPVITSGNNDQQTQYGEIGKSVDIVINLFSVPKYTFYKWYLVDKEIYAQPNKYVITDYPTIVKDKFHGETVMVDGYNVTLTIYELTVDDFNNYTLKVRNNFNVDVNHTVVLESASAPETPGNFSIFTTSLTSITVQWDPKSGGGHEQEFYIEYKSEGPWKFLKAGEEDKDESKRRRTFELKGLQSRTVYELRMYAKNKIKKSNYTIVLTETTKNPDNVSVGAIIGGVAGFLVAAVLLLVVVVFFLKRRKGKFKDDILHDSEEDGLKDNVLYQSQESHIESHQKDYANLKKNNSSSDAQHIEYAEVKKPNAVYGKVDKPSERTKKQKKGKKEKSERKKEKALNNHPDEEYANAISMNDLENRDYATTDETARGIIKNTPGLKYAVLSFDTKGKQRIIHGLEDKTVYSEVDHTQQAPPPPEESAYEETNIKHQRNT